MQKCPVTGVICLTPYNCPAMCAYDEPDAPTMAPPAPLSWKASLAIWCGLAVVLWGVVAAVQRAF